jgi:hypothetical protein
MNRWLVLATGLALVGCNKETCDAKAGIKVGDDSNYSYVATFDVQTIDIAAETDATVCFDQIVTDVRGRPFDASSVVKLSLSEFSLSPAEVTEKVVTNDLKQSDTAVYYERDILDSSFEGQACVQLSDFEIIGNPFIPENETDENTASTWLVTVWNTSAYGRDDILMSVIIRPVEGEMNTEINLSDGSSILGLDPNMSDLTPSSVCAADTKQTFDWSAVTVDTSDHEWDVRAADKLLIGKLSGGVKDAEADFLQLDELAEELYTMNVYGQTFAKLVDDGSTDQIDQEGNVIWPIDLNGDSFTGFTEDGTWLMGIECSTCTSPAPLFLTVLEVGPPSE